MTMLKMFFYGLLLMPLFVPMGLSQDKTDAVGVGISFGTSFSLTDIKGPRDGPTARIFARYYASDYVGLEGGLGLGLLEAEDGNKYFSSLIVPVDIRLIAHLIKEGIVFPYLFAGAGVTYFNPVDKNNLPLPRNARGEYGHQTVLTPLGAGLQYYVTKSTAVELAGSYSYVLSDNLDDASVGSGNDAFWSIMFNMFVFLKTSTSDADRDKLLDREEEQLHTDPHNVDSDGDGLTDGDEVLIYRTDPLKKDTDGDGLNDKDEIFTYKTDPRNQDTDGDGLTDGDEILKYNTNPLNPDTDGDGLLDGDEVLKYHTDPLRRDTDGDELTDGDEVLKYHTNPLDPDTDHGSMWDGKEVRRNLNPLDPSDDVLTIKVGEKIILEGVNFEFAKATLLPGAKVVLDRVAASLLTNTKVEVAVHGHTDNKGSASYNKRLSINRAQSVKDYLVSKGVATTRLTTKGFGFTKPIASNDTDEGRAKNRRTEFLRTK